MTSFLIIEVVQIFSVIFLYYLSAGMLSEDYQRIEKQYKSDEMDSFLQMLYIIADNSEGFRDALGDVFMEYVSHGHNGQFFTPMPISDFMSLTIGADSLQP